MDAMPVTPAEVPRTAPGYAAYLVAGLIATGAWMQLDRFGLLFATGFAGVLAWLAFGVAGAPVGGIDLAFPPRSGTLRSFSIAFALFAPAALFLALTWNQEFPFSGDHDFHLLTAETCLDFWSTTGWLPLLGLVGGWLALRRGLLGAWSLALFLALLAVSYSGDAPWYLARYPAGAYLLGLPAGLFSRLADWDAPLGAARLTTSLSLPVWLLLLRPAIVGRWPDRGALLFGVFFWLQKDAVYYTTTSYAEPWMVVAVLLAAEYLLDKSGRERLNACLITGAAALIKEPAILTLPFFWLACRPWAGTGRDRWRALLVGVVSGLPFLTYYLFRRQCEIGRGLGLAAPADLFSADRLSEFGRRALVQFGWSGLVAVVLGSALAVAWGSRRPGARWKLAMLVAAALFQVGFFWADEFSTDWTGYPRFHLLPLALAGCGLLGGPPPRSRLLGTPAFYACALALLLALQTGMLLPFLRLATRPDVTRNYLEHYEAPVFFPIASLVGEAERDGALQAGGRIRVSDPLGTDQFTMLERGYPTLARRYDLQIVPDSFGAPLCRCSAGGEAVLVPFVYYTGLTPRDPEGPAGQARRRRCGETLRATCARVFERVYRGSTIGLLGVFPAR